MNQDFNASGQKKRRVSRANWLNMALDVLCEGGIEAVRVERLAARLNVAKSGFYYHFGDLNGLKAALLDHWLHADEAPQQEHRKVNPKTTADILKLIVETVHAQKLGELDFAIRQWASFDSEVQAVYRKEVAGRVSHIRAILQAHGFEGDDLEMRTRTFVGYTSTEAQLFGDMSPRKRKQLWNRRIAMLLDQG